MNQENKIQIYNFETNLTKDFLTNESEVENFLLKIKSLKNIAFDLNDKDVVKEVKELKKQAKKSIKILKEVCEPYEAEGKKIANVRSIISTTLISGKNNVIDEILKPILDAETELKKLEETNISCLDLYSVDVKLKELENLKQFNWLIYKDEALELINSFEGMALLKKEVLEKEEKEIIERAEQARKQREEEIARNAAEKARIETEIRIKKEQEAKKEEIKKLPPIEHNTECNDVEHKRKIHNEILQAICNIEDSKSLICKIAKGEIPHLFIKY